MHLPRPEAAFLLALLFSTPAAAAVIDCEHIRVDDVSFNLKPLGGPHSVVTSRWHPPTFTNTTYTVDICKPLKRKGDVKKEEQCPNGTRVCAIESTVHPGSDKGEVEEVIPIAGELADRGGKALDAKVERLKSSNSNSDAQKEGVRLILNGGSYPLNKKGRQQQAIIEFICDRNRTGLEGETSPEEQYDVTPERLRAREDEKDKEGGGGGEDDGRSPDETQILKPDSALIWNSYGPAEKGEMDVLRLTWHTKYACEDTFDTPGEPGSGDASSHWGFFTWFVVLAFLGIAAYLIFGSWLNYNRYGARGWDLLPHGDTIRDIPYLVKDWTRSVLYTVNGSGSRGGYSAV
ncbi:Autophagy-related protein 27 [Colletotrichum orbiculare MAFF 240422]|uniref:Autophagy-related protein 27 n=1 Tax=Colletotrichum orbiculare (strain 104-T / ATCC 96160 / CBS 514.97 / LARS 414 / MAFF 240422) TaxID=1213857 RepID=N4VIM8_COLOR|nr:Autophagy-related protein 27 [Colletotrichum orbiculare MAFF 240422]